MLCAARCRLAALVAGMVAVCACPARGGEYVFTDVMNSTGQFRSFYHPVINDLGTIAFIAEEAPPPGETRWRSGVFMLRDGGLTRLSDASVWYDTGLPINNRDEVAFVQWRPASTPADDYVFEVRRGSEPSNVVTIGTGNAAAFRAVSEPLRLSETGDVFYVKELQRGPVVLKGPDPVADYVMDLQGGDSANQWFLNGFLSDGTPITRARGADGWTFYKGAAREEVALHAGKQYKWVWDYRENARGQKVFWGRPAVWGHESYGGVGIYTGPDRATDTFVETIGEGPPYIARSVLNDQGTVVFLAEFDQRPRALYTGPDPLNDRILGEGDPLFGSVVEEIARDTYYSIANPDYLNNAGQVVFTYKLANGISGIAMATPIPEPGVVLGVVGMAALLGRRRRVRT